MWNSSDIRQEQVTPCSLVQTAAGTAETQRSVSSCPAQPHKDERFPKKASAEHIWVQKKVISFLGHFKKLFVKPMSGLFLHYFFKIEILFKF